MTEATVHSAELKRLQDQLVEFCRFHTRQPAAEVWNLEVLPGHAGLSYSFYLKTDDSKAVPKKLVLRLAPQGVRAAGPADIVRQARIMASLQETPVPVPRVIWFGDDPRWFGAPYYVVEFIEGRNLGRYEGTLTPEQGVAFTRAAVQVMVELHKLDWQKVALGWGDVTSTESELSRIESLLARPTLDPELIQLLVPLGNKLRDTYPGDGRVGCVHGDFQWTNLLFADTRVAALVDWELAMIGPLVLDLAWFCFFSDLRSWTAAILIPKHIPVPEEIIDMYRTCADYNLDIRFVNWYRAFSAYRFGAITVFNLMLHRRGKRIDPTWETLALSVPKMVDRALELCP